MPRQNRPVARDARLQTAKKRTDRSYLRPAGAPTPASPEPVEAESIGEPDAVAEVVAEARQSAAAARLPAVARALQQQGVRKRREVDLQELAVADTRQAIHDIRRIAVLLTLVVITLVVLTIIMR